jgi:hypothetical protein
LSQINYKDTHNEIELKINYIKSQIMKKLATTFGLLALMLIVTSFTTPSEIGGRGSVGTGQYEIGGRGSVGTGQYDIGGRGSVGTGQYEIGGRGSVGTGQ